MTAKRWLRATAGWLGFFAFGHTMGMLSPSSGPDEDAVTAAMSGWHFDAMGTQRTVMDFYLGMGWYLVLNLVVLTWLALWTASLSERSPRDARAPTLALAVFSAVSTAFCARWFFAAPGVASAGATLTAAMALWGLSKEQG